jgi:hypothetical protein
LLNHQLATLARQPRVEREKRTATPEDAEHGGHQCEAALSGDGNDVTACYAELNEVRREHLRTSIEIRVREAFAVVLDCYRVWALSCPCYERIWQTQLRRLVEYRGWIGKHTTPWRRDQ